MEAPWDDNERRNLVASLQKLVKDVETMKLDYERRIKGLEYKMKHINDNIITSVSFIHKVIKSSVVTINTMADRSKKMHQNKIQVVDMDVGDKGK